MLAPRSREIRDIDQIKQSPWNAPPVALPGRISEVVGMLTWDERRMLYWLALHHYTAAGKICDLGAFLGGSTICFATGLHEANLEGRLIHSYDRFTLGPFEQGWVRERDIPVEPDGSTLPLYKHNLHGYHDLLEVHEGDVENHPWRNGPIEILFVDLAKGPRTWDFIVREFFPHLIPGESIVILQDYLYPTSGAWHPVVMEELRDHFEYVVDTEVNSMLFQYTKPLTRDAIEQAMWDRMAPSRKRALMDLAVADARGEKQRETLQVISERLHAELVS